MIQRLAAARPGGQDAEDPEIREALRAAADDPEIGAWLEREQRFDAAFGAKLRLVPIPDDLRDRILAGRKVVSFPPRSYAFEWLAAAAAVALMAVGVFGIRPEAETIAWNRYQADAVGATRSMPGLGVENVPLADIRSWLAERGGHSGMQLPAEIEKQFPLGCATLRVDKKKVSLVCFKLGEKGIAHVFVIDREDVSDPPPDNQPVFAQMGDYSLASWSSGSMSYLLAVNDTARGRTARHLLSVE
jgi:hypothetical protein